MKNASQHIMAALSARGYRVTAARERIVDALARRHTPITIQALTDAVEADEASVYRTIDLLVKEGLIEEINVSGGRPQYAVAHGHHHHAVCNGCGLIVHIPCGGEVKRPTLPAGFSQINAHEVTYYGVCQQCA